MSDMGFGLSNGSAINSFIFKRKYRWTFSIVDVVNFDGFVPSLNTLAPAKSARPSLSFREMEAQHLNETIYYPSKPEWKPINLTLYDYSDGTTNWKHPVFEWIRRFYDPSIETGSMKLSNDITATPKPVKTTAILNLLSGGTPNDADCILERWVFENAYPQNIEFEDLDMGSSDLVYVNLTLRYDRAYIRPA